MPNVSMLSQLCAVFYHKFQYVFRDIITIAQIERLQVGENGSKQHDVFISQQLTVSQTKRL